jgi:hypothetical protein
MKPRKRSIALGTPARFAMLLSLALTACRHTPTKPVAPPQACSCACEGGNAATRAPSCAGDPLDEEPSPQHR